MAKKQAAWWLIGHTPKEASYGAGVANGSLIKWYATDEMVIAEHSGEETTDEDEVKGFVGISSGGVDVTKKRGQLSITTKPSLQLIGFLLKSMMANDSVSGAADPYTHTIKQPTTAIERPDSFSVITGESRHTATTFWKHNGVVPSDFTMEWSQDKPEGSLQANLITDGTLTDASAVSAPTIGTAIKGDRIRFEHLALSFGAQGAAADVTSILRSISIKVEGDIQEEQRASRGTALGTLFHGSNAPRVSIDLMLEGSEGDTRWAFWNAGSVLEMLLTATQTAVTRILTLDVNTCTIPRSVGKIADIENGIVPVLKFPLRAHYTVADASAWIFTVKNDIAAYLA